jgi:hypothetical protein
LLPGRAELWRTAADRSRSCAVRVQVDGMQCAGCGLTLYGLVAARCKLRRRMNRTLSSVSAPSSRPCSSAVYILGVPHSRSDAARVSVDMRCCPSTAYTPVWLHLDLNTRRLRRHATRVLLLAYLCVYVRAVCQCALVRGRVCYACIHSNVYVCVYVTHTYVCISDIPMCVLTHIPMCVSHTYLCV